jgi:hypothetical protein
MFVFGEHARELITPEVGVWLARLLVNPNSSVFDWPELSAAFERARVDPATGRSTSNATRDAPAAAPAAAAATPWPSVARRWVAQLLQQLEVVIVPIESLDSRRQVEAGQLCARKAASNVDLNRCVVPALASR